MAIESAPDCEALAKLACRYGSGNHPGQADFYLGNLPFRTGKASRGTVQAKELQGLKPASLVLRYVAAEAATHKDGAQSNSPQHFVQAGG
jgi:hypothetical protein